MVEGVTTAFMFREVTFAKEIMGKSLAIRKNIARAPQTGVTAP
jgi:hypothetical protein